MRACVRACVRACGRAGSFNLDAPFDYDEYVHGPIQDAVGLVSRALDQIVKMCLGDPSDSALLVNTIESSVVPSVLSVQSKLLQVVLSV